MKVIIFSPQAKYDNLIQENTELNNTKKDNEEIIQKCKKRSLKLAQTVEENQEMYKEQLDKELARLFFFFFFKVYNMPWQQFPNC